MIKTFVIIKVEHYGPMNLVSVHNTFKSALAEMKEAVAKKIDSAKAAHGEDSYHAEICTANNLNSLNYNELAASASIDCDEESTDWGIFFVNDELKFLLVKNIEYGQMSVLFIEMGYNANVPSSRYFAANQREEAIAKAKEIALNRGDTNSIKSIEEAPMIVVHDNKFVKENPQSWNLAGDDFSNLLENITENAGSSTEAGILAMCAAFMNK